MSARKLSFISLLIVFLSLKANYLTPISAQTNHSESLIAFVSYQDGDAEIYTIRSDGSDLRQITHNAEYDNDPAWSPDGSQLVYVHEFELYIMNADGSDSRPIANTFDSRCPAWSLDGRWIIFEQETTNLSDIMRLDLMTGEIQNLTQTNDELEQCPIWSRNGSSIIFTSNGDYPLPRAVDGDPTFNIYSMGLDGLNRHFIHLAGTGAGGLSINSTGTIIYTARRNGYDAYINQYNPTTDSISPLFEMSSYAAQFSPDDSQIVLIHEGQIAIMDADGQNIRKITALEGNKMALAWQPISSSQVPSEN